jgi:UDP-2,4-diacetamido-2,4,6-trideoxy-beta-L-altropyranose hydrolase
MAVEVHQLEIGSPADARHLIARIRHYKAIGVVDGYQFRADYQVRVKESGLKFLLVDDHGLADHYYADFVLNQNIHACENLYRNREPYVQLLLGTRYALLRREFGSQSDRKREIPPMARKLLVTMGGSDQDNVTLKVLKALSNISEHKKLTIKVVVGGGNLNHQSLESFVNATALNTELLYSVNNMPRLMLWADMAIAAGGSTMWELSYMGVPTLIVIIADNQFELAEGLSRCHAAINIGRLDNQGKLRIVHELEHLMKSSEIRRTLSQNAMNLIDGHGSRRVVECLKTV